MINSSDNIDSSNKLSFFGKLQRPWNVEIAISTTSGIYALIIILSMSWRILCLLAIYLMLRRFTEPPTLRLGTLEEIMAWFLFNRA